MEFKFTKQAAEAVRNAEIAAEELFHNYVGTEHLLLGLLRTEGSLASVALKNNGVNEGKLINLIAELIAPESARQEMKYKIEKMEKLYRVYTEQT